MARQNFYTQPYRKEFELYPEFSGGMNSFAPNGDLRDNELALIKNKDLGGRGSLMRRYGMVKTITSTTQSNGQGYFRYFKTDGTYTEIEAVNGKLEIAGVVQTITGLASFQTTKPVEAAQFGTKMYIATGTKLVVYDGTTFAVATAYAPTPLEGLYYGFNALAADPINYMSDAVGGTGVSAAGLTFDKRYCVVNSPVTITGYTIAPAGWAMDYKLEYRTKNMTEGTWTLFRDWTASNKVFTFTPTTTDDHQFKLSVRKTGDTVVSFFQIPKYTVKAAQDPDDVAPNVTNIHGCNRILVHVDRVILYGDTNNKSMIYISHLDNPLYLPVSNCINFDNPQNEALSIVLKYRDKLVAMTNTSVQSLVGKSPLDYQKIMLNTKVGCIAPYSAVVVENFIYFLSYDGVYRLKQVGTVEDRANVDKLDTNISDVMYRDTDACAVFYDLQYHIVFPTKNKRFRYYNELNAWVMDDSTKLDFTNMYVFNSVLYGQSKTNGNILRFDKTVYNDDGYIFEEEIVTKAYSFGQPYHPKSMRELQLLISPKLGGFKAKLDVYIDDIAVLSSLGGSAVVNSGGFITWSPKDVDNISVKNGTYLGEWELGVDPLGEVERVKIKQAISGKGFETKLRIRQAQDHPNEIFGFSFIFKVKKPK